MLTSQPTTPRLPDEFPNAFGPLFDNSDDTPTWAGRDVSQIPGSL